MSVVNKTMLQNLGLVFCAIIVAILLAEGALRLILPLIGEKTIMVEEGGETIRPDPVLQMILVPGGDNGLHDSNGFLNSEVKERYDVVALGDSHTAGGTTSWPREFERKVDVDVYNMGVPGYGPAHYTYLMDKALSFRPKFIIVGLYLGNDIFNAYDLVHHVDHWKPYRAPDFIDDRPALANSLKKTHVPLREVRDFIRTKSVAYRFLSDRTRIWREHLGLATRRTIGTTDWTDTDPDVSLRYDKDPSQKTLFWVGSRVRGLDMKDKNIREGLRLTELFLSEMKARARSSDVTLVIALIPSKDTVYVNEVGDKAMENPIFMEILSGEHAIETALLEYCEKEHIQCFSMLPYLQKKLDEGAVLYKQSWDEHPDALGYETYADAIVEFLSERDMLNDIKAEK